MKKIVFALLFGLATSFNAYAQLDAELLDALPSGEFFLPAPPQEGSLAWMDDSAQYFYYKELGRVYDDAKQEYWDSAWAKMNEQYYFVLYRLGADSVMNVPFLTNVSWHKTNQWVVQYQRNTEDFPQMNALEQLCEKMKTANTSNLWRTRPRPYYYFGDWYSGTLYAPRTADNSSYPSGHGYFAGLFGMCLLYIDPDNSLAIKNMMDEWLNCRLILGAHWKSDLTYGQFLGAMAFAIAMNYDSFRDLVIAAKEELAAYRQAHPVLTDAAPQRLQSPADGKTIVNGQLLIQRDGVSYDALGR